MFKKTKIQLVTLNTVVFSLILCVFGVILYVYMNHIIYKEIDSKLYNVSKEIQHEGMNRIIKEHDSKRESERKIAYLIWDRNDQFIKSIPENAIFSTDINDFSPSQFQDNKLWTQTINNHSYRILKVESSSSYLKNISAHTIEIVLNIDTEVTILQNLLILTIGGCFAAFIISFFAGWLLANRSLVPIQQSWEKQTQFAADASHELRTPLSVIQTHLELLFRHPQYTIEQESMTIYKVLQEVKRMNKLVADLLTLAKTDSNQLLIQRKEFQIGELFSTIIHQFEPIADLRNISISKDIEEQLMYKGDKERIHQLLIILMDNAMKYNVENGKITVTCNKDGSFITIIIEDTGIGIANEELPHIFDRFYRSDKSRTRSEGGTGLGLSIAKWITDAHNGEIKVWSELHKGTRIIIKFPI
ncbi:two-component sensor histidine kinase [Bacillus pseudomycoides]|uniref:histidine kinase n=1 Tax=Bacillus pseudomycoides TaxID=64104 RepID=A0AA91ZS78_9BACI|nr:MULTISPECIES: HAMP domain-containing sensor histidine kinase [Bacillus]PEB51926.1 two-component sensor histidine kinase [Bacillus sp. AFS098217]PED81102.1 two-component sensor histidine kinase [Bacillus pseudomycoides]PEU07187.1 two-component sensor histidine kinase [Bacillus sp. AFS019443]PEU10602.1 two-component sensor histidine kinase [Bacillus sp. AFS014408]PFW59554.1 two-component sensor histidine kinase [Bacillus sp. AFS075034]